MSIPTVSVKGVTLDKNSLSTVKGNMTTLTVTVLPADATNTTVTFASSDESVVTVSADGTVTAVGRGTATKPSL